MDNYPVMRDNQSKAGLLNMIEYIDKITLTKNINMIEVGVYEGDGTLIFSDHFNSVLAIDPWVSGIGDITDKVDMDEIYSRFLENMQGRINISIFRDYSITAAQNIEDESVGLVYIDAGHEYKDVYDDINAWKSKVFRGGWLCGHDYLVKFPGVVKAVGELLGSPDKIFPDNSWVKRIR